MSGFRVVVAWAALSASAVAAPGEAVAASGSCSSGAGASRVVSAREAGDSTVVDAVEAPGASAVPKNEAPAGFEIEAAAPADAVVQQRTHPSAEEGVPRERVAPMIGAAEVLLGLLLLLL